MFKFVERRSTGGLTGPLLGVCAASLIAGCSGIDRELIGDIFDGSGGPGGGGHHPGGGGHYPGSGGPQVTSCGGLIDADDILELVATDLSSLDADDRAFARYLSLADEANAKGCGAVLNTSRAGLNKIVNSVSLSSTLSPLTAIDANQTLYRLDLRDYDWDRVVNVGGASFVDAWEAIIASSPYAVPYVGDEADAAAAASGTAVPVLFGGALVDAVANAPLYYAVLGIPADIDDFLLSDLGIDVDAARASNEIVRAGFDGNQTSASEFLAERFDIRVRSGSVWQLFSGEGGFDALSADPLGTPASQERELVFTLPNGLLAHVVADGDGAVQGDSALTLDTNQNNFRAQVASSYLRLRALGVAPSDEVRQLALASASSFSPEELTRILAVYPSASDREAIVEDDRNALASALARIDIDIDDAPEPASEVFLRFDLDVDLEAAAGALLVGAEELEDNLALLDPALGVLANGSVDRDDFDQLYASSLCILSVVNENVADPDVCEALAL
jgi:hypothetical protein